MKKLFKIFDKIRGGNKEEKADEKCSGCGKSNEECTCGEEKQETKEMTEVSQVYRCLICGNTVKVLKAGAGELVCCGQPMELQTEEEK